MREHFVFVHSHLFWNKIHAGFVSAGEKWLYRTYSIFDQKKTTVGCFFFPEQELLMVIVSSYMELYFSSFQAYWDTFQQDKIACYFLCQETANIEIVDWGD